MHNCIRLTATRQLVVGVEQTFLGVGALGLGDI